MRFPEARPPSWESKSSFGAGWLEREVKAVHRAFLLGF